MSVNLPNSLCDKDDHNWLEALHKMVVRINDERLNAELFAKYQQVFSKDYQSLMRPRYAISDMLALEQTLQSKQVQVDLLAPSLQKSHYRLNFYSLEHHFLDEYFPVLANLNLRVIDQVQFPLQVAGQQVFIKSFSIADVPVQCDSFKALRARLLHMIRMLLHEKVDNDALNKLLLATGMVWQAIDVLRAYRNYFLQLDHTSTRDSVHRALINNPQVALNLYNYFEARFNPDIEWRDNQQREEQALFPWRIKLLQQIETVADINHDRILRAFFNLIDATVRSNFYVRKDLQNYFIAFKVNSLGVINMLGARPQNEIYVHSVAMQGIHLRGGRISRGGIRWSDRIDDFRTEILGLMQTQMSKNVLIIPKGAKGGFIVKKDYQDKAYKEAGKQAYINFIRGLLDLTDNYQEGKAENLPGIISYDDHDPYLVVAADKGTAQFSDIANQVAEEYHYWLGDAFASGGSRGYNHKQLGITARGAWESVKRHFRELGKDIQHQAFSVVGIGSMDGDVFGNGMLLSPVIRLLAAFSGEHILIDPDPLDLQAAFEERKRLFYLPASSWDDYNRQLLSEGGGVFRRDAKVITVSPALKKWLRIPYKSIDGEALVRYLLTAEVELLWLAGIGCYIKASHQEHNEVGDRNNDVVRVDASALKAQVVAEGANLGFTQQARVQYSLAGGRINCDAIDNSAGVDISDHEVNLKILLQGLSKQQAICGSSTMLRQMSESVVQAVLQNNYKQTLCLSLEQIRSAQQLQKFMLLAEQLDAANFLDRRAEFFPDDKAVQARRPPRLTRPEFAVLMAAAKMQMTQLMLEDPDFLSNEQLTAFLLAYFPHEIQQSYANHIQSHPLAKEIKATCICNKIINQAGVLFLNNHKGNKQRFFDHCLNYLIFEQIMDADGLRQEIFEHDNKVDSSVLYQALLEIENILSAFCEWAFINEISQQFITQAIGDMSQGFQQHCLYFKQHLHTRLELSDEINLRRKQGFTTNLAEKLCFVNQSTDFPELVRLSLATNKAFTSVLKSSIEFKSLIAMNRVFLQLRELSVKDAWEAQVLSGLFYEMQRLISNALQQMMASNQTVEQYVTAPERAQVLQDLQLLIRKITAGSQQNVMPFIVLKSALVKFMNTKI